MFQELSRRIGSRRVIWRYDPVFLSGRYTVDYHERAFAEIAGALSGYTCMVVISFLDLYKKTKRNMEHVLGGAVKAPAEPEMKMLAQKFATLARRFGMEIRTCAEQVDLEQYGIRHGACIDREYIEELLGCRNGCRYCYANDSDEAVRRLSSRYDVHSPILCGQVEEEDRITERQMKTLKDLQISLWNL